MLAFQQNTIMKKQNSLLLVLILTTISVEALVENQILLRSFLNQNPDTNEFDLYLAGKLVDLADICYNVFNRNLTDNQNTLAIIIIRSLFVDFINKYTWDSFRRIYELFGASYVQQDKFLMRWKIYAKHNQLRILDNLNPRAPNNIVKFAFLSQIRDATISPHDDPGQALRDLINGTGTCKIFEHPNKSRFNFEYAEYAILFSKFGYLTRFMHENLGFIAIPIIHFEHLSMICRYLERLPLRGKKRKNFLQFFLEKESLIRSTPWTSLKDYKFVRSPSDPNSFCGLLIERLESKKENLKRRYPDIKTRTIFYEECFDDLVQLWNLKYNESEDWQPYHASVINRWLYALDYVVYLEIDESNRSLNRLNFLMRSISRSQQLHKTRSSIEELTNDILTNVLNPRTNKNLDTLLRSLIDELPAKVAIEAYETGDGLCNVSFDKALDEIYQVLAKIATAMTRENISMTGNFLGRNHILSPSLIQFAFLRIMCDLMRAEPTRRI